MSTSQSHSHSLEGNAHGTTSTRKVAISSGIGATIEAYDFIGYGTAAALYFSTDFFPSGDPLTGTLLSFATLGVGFLVRPLGGVVGGYLGDKVGRKPVLVASLMLMGLATFCIGLLPTYASVGIWAGILLVLVRVVQGLAYGAEWGGAILMTYEHAPWRNKGKYTGIVQAGFPVGLLLANLVFLVSVHLPGTWAWRVPFLLSIVLVIVGLIIRSKIPESPVFEEVKARGEIVKNPITQVIKEDWRNILRGIGLRIAETAGYAVAITFMLSYLKTEKLADNTLTLVAICVASAHRHLRHLQLGQSHRQGRPPTDLPVRHHRHGGLRVPDVHARQHRDRGPHRGRRGHRLRRHPELPRRCAGLLVPRTVQRQHPLLRRLDGLPVLRRGLRVHPVRRHPAVLGLGLGRRRLPVLPLRPHRPGRHPDHQGNLRPGRTRRRPSRRRKHAGRRLTHHHRRVNA